MLGYIHKDTETGCLIPVTTAGPVGGTVEKLEYGCNKNYALPLTENTAGEGYVGISCEYPIYYNPASGLLTVESICGNITNADIAECVAVNNTNSNVSFNIPLICDNKIYKTANSNITYNPGTSQLTVNNGSICVAGGPNCSIINCDCVVTTCLSSIETNTGCVNASSVTTMCLDANCICTGYCGMLSGYLNGYQPDWGNQTGTAVAGWCDCTGGEVYFRRDNPTYGQLSMILDGTVYVDEGRYAVIHEGNIGNQTVCKAYQAYNSVSAGNETDLVYAGELISSIGESLTSILDKIKAMLGPFEYYYDIDGRFIFQEKQIHSNHSWNTLQKFDNNVFARDAEEDSQYSYSFEDVNLI